MKLRRFKSLACIVLFTFTFQFLGLSNLALALTYSFGSYATDDPLIACSIKTRTILNELKSIQGGLSRGEDQTSRLAAVSSEMSEVIGLRSTVAAKLGETEANLRQSGPIPPEIITRHTDFATKTLSAFANLETIAANLAALIAQGNPTAGALDSLITALQTLAPPPPSIPVDPQLPHRMAAVELISPPPLPPITPGITPPGPQDLAPTRDVQITPEIQALANQLNNDPEEIFLYVRNTIDYQPYFGSVKGSPGAYWEKAGNDMDQASLLLALLRAANIPCRYISGTVRFNRNTMLNWTGAKTTQALLNILSTSGIPFDNLLGTRAQAISISHTWVLAYVGDQWVRMAPAVKTYEYLPGIDVQQTMGFDLNTFYNNATAGAVITPSSVTSLNEANINADLQAYAANLSAWVNANMPNATVGDVVGCRKIVPLSAPGNYFPISPSTPQYEFSELPWTWVHWGNFQMYLGFNYVISLPELYGQSLTLTAVPATPADQALIDQYGGIFNVPEAYLVSMKPQLKLEGQVVAEGPGVQLGSMQYSWGCFLKPQVFSETPWENYQKMVIVGADYSVSLDHQKMSTDLLQQRAERFNTLVANLPGGVVTQEVVEEALHLTGMVYFGETDSLRNLAAAQAKITWTRLPALNFVYRDLLVEYSFTTPLRVHRGAVTMDFKRNITNGRSTLGRAEDERAWFLSTGALGSAAEHAVFEQLYQVEAVSTEKILTLANRQGIPIYTIDQNNLGQIDTLLAALSDNARYYIYLDVYNNGNYGRSAVVPQNPIQLNQWQGVGWIVLNPATGSAGYYILGSLAHPSATIVTIAGGSGTTPANDGDWLNMPLKIHDLLIILGLIDFGAVLVATGLGYNVLGPLGAGLGLTAALAGSPFYAAGIVCLGAAIIAIGVFVTIKLLTASNLNYSRRRWYALSGRMVTIS